MEEVSSRFLFWLCGYAIFITMAIARIWNLCNVLAHTGCSVIVWTLFVEQIKQISGRGEGLTKQ
jgi:hypothetical protein